jgi:hypothetical protein
MGNSYETEAKRNEGREVKTLLLSLFSSIFNQKQNKKKRLGRKKSFLHDLLGQPLPSSLFIF